MAKSANSILANVAELDRQDLVDIQVPANIFEVIPFNLCKQHRLLPLRLDQELKVLSLAFVDESAGKILEQLKSEQKLLHISLYHVDEEVFDQLIVNIEEQLDENAESVPLVEEDNEVSDIHESAGWTIALIEPEAEIRESVKNLLLSQGYTVVKFDTEEDFRKEIEKLSAQLNENEDLVNLAEKNQIIPYQAVVVRKQVLHTPSTFCDSIWAHFGHLRISILEDRWLGNLIQESQFQDKAQQDDFSFHLKHRNYYHAAVECLKKAKIFQAVELLEQVSTDDAHYIKAKVLLGKAFLKKRNYNKALSHFQAAYDYWCEDPDGIVDDHVLKLLYLLAYTFEKMGRLEDALKLYERVASENPLFREVSGRLVKVKTRQKKAIKDSEKKLGLPAFSKTQREQHRYERLEEIGKGGMGIVYLGRDRVLGREVALKILNSHFKHDEKIVETFLREAKSLAALNHLNIVTIFDAGIEDGNYYISMEFIEGRTVRELLKKKGHFRLSTSLALSKQVLKALAYAHSKHVIHRDITTNNMMLTETKVVKLMDFGLARVVNQLHSEQSIIGGTPYFMSPEQVEGAPIDHRTDIYSFGVCLFEMLTGQVPFPMENPGYHHLHTQAPDPRTIKADLPESVCSLILRCLEKKPEDRPQSADNILDEIRRIGPELKKQSDLSQHTSSSSLERDDGDF